MSNLCLITLTFDPIWGEVSRCQETSLEVIAIIQASNNTVMVSIKTVITVKEKYLESGHVLQVNSSAC